MKSPLNPLLARLRSKIANPDHQGGMVDVTAVIQNALRGAGLIKSDHPQAPRAADNEVIEGEFHVLDEVGTPQSRRARPQSAAGSFTAGNFTHEGSSRQYKLFLPAGHAGTRLPLIVMLHGCTQDPDDFARGTRMNQLAQEPGAIVLYPAQAPRSNTSKCWNWFQPGDQRRDHGEPALLAALTRQIIGTQAVDPDRVYVTGLSAGGAMAAILGREYPDLFAAIGVHSGLAAGAAHDIPSAFAAMKKAPAASPQLSDVPVIVFHGDRDATVDPANAHGVIGSSRSSEGRKVEEGNAGHRYTRSVYSVSGRVRAEHWLVHGAGHAWSGGSSEGSYVDIQGPDASREMLRFFMEHPRGR